MKHTTGMYPSISVNEMKLLNGSVAVVINGKTIPLFKQPCNFGGYRYWFICPICQGKKGRLYLHQGGIKCRTCADLTYFSSQTRCHYDKVYAMLKRYWGEGARVDREYERVYKQKRKQTMYKGKTIKRLRHRYY